MKPVDRLFRAIIFIIGIIVVCLAVQLFLYCKQQSVELSSMKDKLDVEAEFNSNKFKYQQDQIESLSKNLDDAQQQIKDQKSALSDDNDAIAAQKDALLQEVEKRQQVANESKGMQASLTDVKAEADAIKQDMKGWQKDYVSVLAELEKKMDYTQDEIKSLNDHLNSFKENMSSLEAEIEKIKQSADNTPSTIPPTSHQSDNP